VIFIKAGKNFFSLFKKSNNKIFKAVSKFKNSQALHFIEMSKNAAL
jgi:hypothetical protein